MFIFTNLSFAGGFELIERCKDSGLTIGGLKLLMTGLGPPMLLIGSISFSGFFLIALIKDVFSMNKSAWFKCASLKFNPKADGVIKRNIN